MPSTQREMAYYGGWATRNIAGGNSYWGDPLIRNMEVRNISTLSKLWLPDPTVGDFQAGVSYHVFNLNQSGETNLAITVADHEGNTIGTVDAGSGTGECGFGEFVYAGSWVKIESGTGFISQLPLNASTLEFSLSGNYANVNLYDYAVAQGYAGQDDTTIIVNVEAGTLIGSSSQSQPSMTTDIASKWGSNCNIRINLVSSNLLGWGGTGGQGADGAVSSVGDTGAAGGDGGDALHCYIDTDINVISSLLCAGGGGGGGAGNWGSPSPTTGYAGNGGGGAQGLNMLPTGVVIPCYRGLGGDPGDFTNQPAYAGTNGSRYGAGVGDVSANLPPHPGGDGGDYGDDGSPGATGGTAGGVGGARGVTIATAAGVSVTGTMIVTTGNPSHGVGYQGTLDQGTSIPSAAIEEEL